MSKHRPLPLMVEPLETRLMFAIELDIVALHEFGHSLGLAHYADTPANSIMEAYYNASYNKADLATDVAVLANGGDGYSNLHELFNATTVGNNTSSWKNSLDPTPGNGRVDISYSFVPDGTKLDSNKRSNLFSAIAPDVGGASNLQALLIEELNRWGSVSNGFLSFFQRSDNGANSGTGAAQNDPNFGDIRIGGHRFDGAGGVLAHAYYPPPNGGSTAGDAHFASEEAWINGDPLTAAGVPVGRFARLIHTAEGYFYKCTFGEHDHDHADELRSSDGHDQGDHDHDSDALATTPAFVSTVGSSQFKLAENATARQSTFRAPVFVSTEKSAAITSTRSAGELTQKQLSFALANGSDVTTAAPITSSTQKNGGSQRDVAADVWNAYVI